MLVNVCPDNIFWTTEHVITKPGMVMQHHKPECLAEKLLHCIQCQGHSESWYNQNTTISVVSSKLLVRFVTKLALIIKCHKPECPVEKWDYCFQGQGHSKGSKYQWMFVRIFSESEYFVTNFGMVMRHHEPECSVDLYVCVCVCVRARACARVCVCVWGELSSMSRSQRGLIWSEYDLNLFSELLSPR